MTCKCTTVNQTVEVVNQDCCHSTKHSDKYDVTLTVNEVWMMPAVNELTTIIIQNCRNLLPHAWLWNKSVGYLEVIRYNNTTGETVVKNLGLFGNAAPNTVFPSCMDFVISSPYPIENQCEISLQADFVSPAEDECALMVVSNASLFKKNYTIVVDIYQYRVTEVVSPTMIKVCNDGLGKTGTIEVPCDGTCVPIKILNADSACVQDTTTTANALVSCVAGSSKLLVGNEDNQFAYWDNTSGEWKLINSNIVKDCSVTTSPVQITEGNVGPYAVFVKDVSPFSVGDRLTIGDIHDGFVVTEIFDELIRVQFNEAPTEDTTWDIGTRLCIVDCCDWISQVIDTLTARIADVEADVSSLESTVSTHTQQIEDLWNNIPSLYSTTDLVTAPTSVLSIDSGTGRVIGTSPVTITLDTDLSKYSNTTKQFVTSGANNSSAGFSIYTGGSSSTSGDKTLQFNTISAGSGINITSSSGVLTVSATGGGGGGGGGVSVQPVSNYLSWTPSNLVESSKSANNTFSTTIGVNTSGSTRIVGTVSLVWTGTGYCNVHWRNDDIMACNQVKGKIQANISCKTQTYFQSDFETDSQWFFLTSTVDSTKNNSGTINFPLTIPFALMLPTGISSTDTINISVTVSCPNAKVASGGDDDSVRIVSNTVKMLLSATVYY